MTTVTPTKMPSENEYFTLGFHSLDLFSMQTGPRTCSGLILRNARVPSQMKMPKLTCSHHCLHSPKQNFHVVV